MTTGLELEVSPPPLHPPVVGLLQAAEVIEHGAGDDRWFAGITWQPSNSADVETVAVGNCASTFAFATTNTYSTPPTYDPFAVVAHDSCSTWIARNMEGYRDRARRVLEAKEWGDVEEEFESGTLISTNPHLADTSATFPAGGNVTTTPALSPKDALAILDEAIAEARIGLGMIHAPHYVVAQWVAGGMVEWKSGDVDGVDSGVSGDGIPPLPSTPILFSPNGNIIVAGSGYVGRGPTGLLDSTHAIMWAYATDLVTVHREATPHILPDPSDPIAFATSPSTNTVLIRAHRTYAIEWSKVLHAAVKVDTTLAAGVSGGSVVSVSNLPAVNQTVQSHLFDVAASTSWTAASNIPTGTLVSLSFSVVLGTADVTDADGTVISNLPVGYSASWEAPYGGTLTPPTTITADSASRVIVCMSVKV